MAPPITIALDQLVFAQDLYPRTMPSSVVTADLVEAYKSGSQLPPIVVDEDSLQVIDGWHRCAAFRRMGLAEIPAVLVKTESAADLFARAVEANSAHGSRLTPYDHARAIQKLTNLGVDLAATAKCLRITPEKCAEIQRGWFATSPKGEVAVKRTIQHMRGLTLTDRQVEANKRLSGMQQTFYAMQLIELIEADLVDWRNPALVARLQQLSALLAETLAARAA